jgi:RES domain-containing protein
LTAAVKAWRIGTTTREYAADSLDGNGAASSPGRWNDVNQHVIYAAPTLAMAVLETAAHIRPGSIPLDRFVVSMEVPGDLWDARVRVPASALPVGWDAVPGSMIAVEFGNKWYTAQRSLILEVPSAIAPEEPILLINASHPGVVRLKARATRRFEYERLFRP